MPLVGTTRLRLIKGISFDDEYRDVILFNTRDEQTAYFTQKAGVEFDAHSYQRAESNYVKVTKPYKDMVGYCYLMFRNADHEDRWWYAFVDEIVYVNEQTTGVRFHIDIMQSHMFDYTIGKSFVVREHSKTDKPGDNIVPENIYFGEYEYDLIDDQLEVDASKCPFGFSGTLSADDMMLVIAYNPAIFDIAKFGISGDYVWSENLYGGVYQGLRFVCLPFTTKMSSDVIEELVGLLDTIITLYDVVTVGGVISAFMMPIIFLPEKGEVTWENKRHGVGFDAPTGFANHSLKNNKLLTYPYVALNATNGRNEGVDYAYEYFINRGPYFFYEGSLSLNPSCLCYPVGYKGKTFAVEDGLTIDSYPIASWGQDGLSEWVSNHMFQTALGVGLSVATSGASAYASLANNAVASAKYYDPNLSTKEAKALVGNMKDRGAALADSAGTSHASATVRSELVSSAIGILPQIAATPKSTNGVNAHDLIFGNPSGKSIKFRRKHIRTEYVKKLDAYFTRFGYATNEHKVPDIKSRPYWNYLQLEDAHITNIKCPMNAINKIKEVLERGVTFWRPNATIGDYDNQDNSV